MTDGTPPGGPPANDAPTDLDVAVRQVEAALARLTEQLAITDPDGFQLRRLRQKLRPDGFYRVPQSDTLLDVVRKALDHPTSWWANLPDSQAWSTTAELGQVEDAAPWPLCQLSAPAGTFCGLLSGHGGGCVHVLGMTDPG